MKKRRATQLVIALFGLIIGFSPIGAAHLPGKITWIIGGANGMKLMDWIDVLFHGSSLIISLIMIFLFLISFRKKVN